MNPKTPEQRAVDNARAYLCKHLASLEDEPPAEKPTISLIQRMQQRVDTIEQAAYTITPEFADRLRRFHVRVGMPAEPEH